MHNDSGKWVLTDADEQPYWISGLQGQFNVLIQKEISEKFVEQETATTLQRYRSRNAGP